MAARIPDAEAYFQFTLTALQAVVDSHPKPDALRSCLRPYLDALIDQSLAHSVSEGAMLAMRLGRDALLAPPP